MSTNSHSKLRAGKGGEMTRLKTIWRDSLTEDARDRWRSLFLAAHLSQAQIRMRLRAELGVNLKYDSQLNAFRDWEMAQRACDLEAERMAADEKRLLAEHPDWSKDQVREDVLRKSYLRARATGDFGMALKTVVADVKLETLQLDSRRVALLEKKAAAYDRAQQVLDAAKTSKGGVTLETMRHIERELHLMP